MKNLSEKTWQFPYTGIALRFPATNILAYLLGQNETLPWDFSMPTTTTTYSYDYTCSCTTGTTTINHYNPGNSSINSGKTGANYDYDDLSLTTTRADSRVYYYGYRYYSPELGRWVSRDPIGEWGGMNLYAFLQNRAINAIDSFGLDCKSHSREGFEKWLETELGMTITEDVSRKLDRGCVGLPALDTGSDIHTYPERQGNTTCWLTKEEAKTKGCDKCKELRIARKCSVFAKEGKWANFVPEEGPNKNSDGSVSCYSVTSKSWDPNDYNYFLVKGGYYLYVSGKAEPGYDQIFWVCTKPKQSDYARIWVARCVKECGIPEPTDEE